MALANALKPTPASSRRGRARPPGPAGDPILGSLRQLRSDPLNLFVDAASRYGDLVMFRAVHRRVYLVAGPELIAHVGVANRGNYKKGVSYDALRVPIGDALLTADGATAQARRRLLMPLFTRRSLLDAVPTIATAVASCFERWDELAASGKPFDVALEMNRLAFDVVGRLLLGVELGESMTRLAGLIDDASAWVARRTRALLPLPPVIPTGANRAYRRAETEITVFTERLLIERRQAEHRGEDMVSRLVAAREADQLPISDQTLRDEVNGFLMAGHQTTGATLAWTWYLLGRHPEVARRLAREVDQVLDGGHPAADDLDRLTYLGQVLNESMRLYPAGWAFTRTPIADDELGGYVVPAGSILIISSYANQRNPRFWPTAEEFDPDRFAPERPAPEPYLFFPFGVGPHACIGKHMALIESTVAIAMLAQRYRLELIADRPVRATPAITLTPADPIWVRATRRTASRFTSRAAPEGASQVV